MIDLRQAAQQALECIERLNMRGFILADYEDEVYAAITALREALAQDKLRGLENLLEESIKALRTALEQPEQEPVAWAVQGITQMIRGEFAELDAKSEARRIGGTCVAYPLYAAPPAAQRPWQGLTDEEIESAISDGFARGLDDGNVSNQTVIKYVRGIEAALRSKNT